MVALGLYVVGCCNVVLVRVGFWVLLLCLGCLVGWVFVGVVVWFVLLF